MKNKTLLVAVLCSIAKISSAQTQTKAIDIPQNGIVVLMGVITLILLLIILRLAGMVKQSTDFKNNGENTKKGLMLLLMTGSTLMLRAQDAAEEVAEVVQPSGWYGVPVWVWMVFIITVILELVAINMQLNILKQQNFPVTEDDTQTKKQNWFARFNDTVPQEEYAALDMNHDYDGISELDNKIPRWWLYTFYATIIFGAVYMYRMFGSHTIPSQYEQLEASITEAKIEQRKRDELMGGAVDENTVTMADEAGIAKGQSLFYANCRACHGDKAQGAEVGPNLIDAYWLHGGSLKDVFHSIQSGWPDKGMQSWEAILSPSETKDVASYIMSMQGQEIPGARAPQGDLFTPEEGEAEAEEAIEETQEAADSMSTTSSI